MAREAWVLGPETLVSSQTRRKAQHLFPFGLVHKPFVHACLRFCRWVHADRDQVALYVMISYYKVNSPS